MIGAMAREEEGGRIRERGIIDSSEQDSGIGQVIMKPQLANYQALMPVAWQSYKRNVCP